MNKYRFLDRLSKRGYEKLGWGSYSSVWAKPNSSKVIKVGVSYDSWLNYIEWAMKNGYVGNKAPRVDSFKLHNGYFTAVMERLHGLNRDNRNSIHNMTYANSFVIRRVPAEWKTFTTDFTKEFGNHNDLHDGNWMQRSNGELVLIDPIYEKGRCLPSRHRSRPRHSISSLRNDPALVWC